MKHIVKSALVILISSVCVFAQNPKSATQQAEELRGQLRGVIDKEAELQIRLQQIEEDLKPENIQRSIALVGTTRPGDLREQRRSQLEKEKMGVQAQLEQLASSRLRMDAAIITVETEVNTAPTPAAATPPPLPPTTNRVEPSPSPTVIRQQPPSKRPVPRSRRKRPRRRSG